SAATTLHNLIDTLSKILNHDTTTKRVRDVELVFIRALFVYAVQEYGASYFWDNASMAALIRDMSERVTQANEALESARRVDQGRKDRNKQSQKDLNFEITFSPEDK